LSGRLVKLLHPPPGHRDQSGDEEQATGAPHPPPHPDEPTSSDHHSSAELKTFPESQFGHRSPLVSNRRTAQAPPPAPRWQHQGQGSLGSAVTDAPRPPGG